MRSVTVDTNVYVSALQFGGKPMALLEMAVEGEIQVAISQPIIDETLRVLRDKFSWGPTGLEDARTLIMCRCVGIGLHRERGSFLASAMFTSMFRL